MDDCHATKRRRILVSTCFRNGRSKKNLLAVAAVTIIHLVDYAAVIVKKKRQTAVYEP